MIGLALGVLGLGFPIGLMFAISRISGWHDLALRYPLTGAAPKPLTVVGYGIMRNWVGYNGGLVLSADAAGLYVSTWAIFAWCHKPIFLPWTQIVSATARRCYRRVYYVLALRGAPDAGFAVREDAFQLARPFLAEARVPVVDVP